MVHWLVALAHIKCEATDSSESIKSSSRRLRYQEVSISQCLQEFVLKIVQSYSMLRQLRASYQRHAVETRLDCRDGARYVHLPHGQRPRAMSTCSLVTCLLYLNSLLVCLPFPHDARRRKQGGPLPHKEGSSASRAPPPLLVSLVSYIIIQSQY